MSGSKEQKFSYLKAQQAYKGLIQADNARHRAELEGFVTEKEGSLLAKSRVEGLGSSSLHQIKSWKDPCAIVLNARSSENQRLLNNL